MSEFYNIHMLMTVKAESAEDAKEKYRAIAKDLMDRGEVWTIEDVFMAEATYI